MICVHGFPSSDNCPECTMAMSAPKANCRLCNDEGCSVCTSANLKIQDSDELQPAKPYGQSRYLVTVQHQIILYGDTLEEVKAKAPLLYQGLMRQQAARPLEVVAIEELGTLASEKQSERIDVSPILQRST